MELVKDDKVVRNCWLSLLSNEFTPEFTAEEPWRRKHRYELQKNDRIIRITQAGYLQGKITRGHKIVAIVKVDGSWAYPTRANRIYECEPFRAVKKTVHGVEKLSTGLRFAHGHGYAITRKVEK